MNPFQAIMGMMNGGVPGGVPNAPSAGPLGTGSAGPSVSGRPSSVPSGPPGPPVAGFGNPMQMVQRLAQQFQNPQMLVDRFFPNAPEEVRNDPEQLVGWMQQSGMVTPQMIQMARSMMGGR